VISRVALGHIMPHAPAATLDAFADPINAAMREFGVDAGVRHEAAFLSQIAHETLELRYLRENLNYSAEGLLKTFASHFTPEEAVQYAHQPERIANRVYANRMGNGDEASGDGWRFRGGGVFHHTGCGEFMRGSREVLGDASILLRNPDRIVEPAVAARLAAWYWRTHRLGTFVDAGDFDGLCDAINIGHKTRAIGDANGYVDRLTRFDGAMGVLTAAALAA
jgi:putative chitinase